MLKLKKTKIFSQSSLTMLPILLSTPLFFTVSLISHAPDLYSMSNNVSKYKKHCLNTIPKISKNKKRFSLRKISNRVLQKTPPSPKPCWLEKPEKKKKKPNIQNFFKKIFHNCTACFNSSRGYKTTPVQKSYISSSKPVQRNSEETYVKSPENTYHFYYNSHGNCVSNCDDIIKIGNRAIQIF